VGPRGSQLDRHRGQARPPHGHGPVWDVALHPEATPQEAPGSVSTHDTRPFLDGDGRTGRGLLNLILARLGYAPAIIQKRERPQCLDALRATDTDHAAQRGDDGRRRSSRTWVEECLASRYDRRPGATEGS
jgi:hypothetical protein